MSDNNKQPRTVVVHEAIPSPSQGVASPLESEAGLQGNQSTLKKAVQIAEQRQLQSTSTSIEPVTPEEAGKELSLTEKVVAMPAKVTETLKTTITETVPNAYEKAKESTIEAVKSSTEAVKHTITETVPSAYEKAKETTMEAVHIAGEKLSHVAEQAKNVAVTAGEKVSHVVDTLKPTASAVGEKLSEAAHVLGEKVVAAKDTLTSDEAKTTAQEVALETKDMIVSAATVTKDTIVEGAHVARDVAATVYHWVADTVMQAKENIHPSLPQEDKKEDEKREEQHEELSKRELSKEETKESERVERKEPLSRHPTERTPLLLKPQQPSPLITMEQFPVQQGTESNSEFHHYLKSNAVIPDVFHSLFDNVYTLEFDFGTHRFSGLSDIILAPGQCESKPNIYFSALHMPSQYSFLTLAMIDPDVPNRREHNQREYVHWLVGNIPSGHISKEFRVPVEQGQELVKYTPPTPPLGSGRHRYMLCLFEHKEKSNFDDFTRISGWDGRTHFHLQNFANGYKLNKPVAFTMFQSESEKEIL